MTHPDQSDFLANRIRYVQNQPHLQQPPAPETSLGSDPSWFIRFPLVHQAPESPGQPGLPGPPSSPGPAVHQAQGPPKFTILQQPRKRMQFKWDDGSLQCLYANSCWVWIRKTNERTFLSDTREVVMGEGILQLPTWWHGSLVTTSTSWPALPPPLPHYPADLVRRAERALLLPANNPTTTLPPNPELDTS